jgi:hypothetical protein
MTTLPQGDLPKGSGIFRTDARRNHVNVVRPVRTTEPPGFLLGPGPKAWKECRLVRLALTLR